MARASAEPRHQLRAWRKFRGKTLEQAAEFVGTTHQNLGKIERGLVPYSQALLEKLAEFYNTDPGALIMRDPNGPATLLEAVRDLTPTQEVQAAAVIEALKRTGTDG